MKEKLREIQARYDELSAELAKPDVFSDQDRYKILAKEHKDLQPIVEKSKEYLAVLKNLEEYLEILQGSDTELKELVNEEIDDLKAREAALQEELKMLLIPKDPNKQELLLLVFSNHAISAVKIYILKIKLKDRL